MKQPKIKFGEVYVINSAYVPIGRCKSFVIPKVFDNQGIYIMSTEVMFDTDPVFKKPSSVEVYEILTPTMYFPRDYNLVRNPNIIKLVKMAVV